MHDLFGFIGLALRDDYKQLRFIEVDTNDFWEIWRKGTDISVQSCGTMMPRFSIDNTTKVARLPTVQGVAIGLDDLVGTRAPVAATRVKNPRNQIEQQRDAVPLAVSYPEHLEVAFCRLHSRIDREACHPLLGRAFITITRSGTSFGSQFT